MATNIALIPAYKPSDVLLTLVHDLCESGLAVVVVDDGGGAEFEEIFTKCEKGATVLHHEVNMGKGAALKTGLAYIKETYCDDCTVVTVDADGQHTVKDSMAVLSKAHENPNALVLGSRKFVGDVPLRSRFGNSLTRFVYRVFSGVKLHDTQTGLRAFSGALIPELLKIGGNRYEYEMNMLLEFADRKYPILEHEIETIYENNNESSHFNPILDSVRIYAQILKFSASSLIGFIVDYILYTLLFFISDNISLSNIGARIVSASVNFTLNRKIVFKSNENIWKSALKYVALAIVILVGNTLVLHLLVDICFVNELLAKVITEVIFFIFSWLVQKFFVFKRR